MESAKPKTFHICEYMDAEGNLCGKVYTSRCNLRRHMKAHEGIVHMCEHCDFVTVRRDAWKHHMKVKHTTYTCIKCNKSFLGAKPYKQHYNVCALQMFHSANADIEHMMSAHADIMNLDLDEVHTTVHDVVRQDMIDMEAAQLQDLADEIDSYELDPPTSPVDDFEVAVCNVATDILMNKVKLEPEVIEPEHTGDLVLLTEEEIKKEPEEVTEEVMRQLSHDVDVFTFVYSKQSVDFTIDYLLDFVHQVAWTHYNEHPGDDGFTSIPARRVMEIVDEATANTKTKYHADAEIDTHVLDFVDTEDYDEKTIRHRIIAMNMMSKLVSELCINLRAEADPADPEDFASVWLDHFLEQRLTWKYQLDIIKVQPVEPKAEEKLEKTTKRTIRQVEEPRYSLRKRVAKN